jgi:hypothetical protein
MQSSYIWSQINFCANASVISLSPEVLYAEKFLTLHTSTYPWLHCSIYEGFQAFVRRCQSFRTQKQGWGTYIRLLFPLAGPVTKSNKKRQPQFRRFDSPFKRKLLHLKNIWRTEMLGTAHSSIISVKHEFQGKHGSLNLQLDVLALTQASIICQNTWKIASGDSHDDL